MNRIFDRYAGVAFLLVGAAFVWESRKIGESSYGSNVGPDIFPMGLGILLILLSARLLYETLRGRMTDAASGEKPRLDYKRFGILVGAALLYAYFLEDIGYVLGTFLFLLLGFQVIERGRWLVSLLVSALFSFGVYYLFVQVLEGTLPGFPSWMNLG
ncbi:tripartite tricarboxylate transporter TctB family protein [Paenibacillus pasadenensis]|uniref:Tricarboxylate transport protein TctB n=1 Tax=Paenibacillus pasadenensis TaxID=217090 RepID=A0A2N5NCY9_9BACL|nr:MULTISPECIES: tripartite tricarboxylate transporter TctB family protein [Paenibacillus]PLT48130.1 Tricarboxylate transport protein TctB [Paenibacillus pasadenensis]QGG58350.1 tripartite tricarboxylate transporter TctB family protein [Paenibacillus sp. B01]